MRIILIAALCLNSLALLSQGYRPELLFREDWKEIPAEIPVNQNHISNEDLLLATYGQDSDSLKKSHHDQPVDDPYYLWSGLSKDTWAVTLKHRDYLADLTGYAKIRWRTKQSGFRNLRILLKLADGRWLVSDLCDGSSADWRISEFNMSDIQWWELDMDRIVEMKPLDKREIDLSKVDEIGCTDLMRGGESNACSRLDWIEVYARPVPRK